MIRFENVTFGFGEQFLFQGLNLHILPADRIGLVGPNGAGKTTLLKLCFGLLSPDAGKIVRRGNLEVAYLPQESVKLSRRTVGEEVLSVFSRLLNIEKQLQEIHQQLGSLPPESAQAKQLLHRAGTLQNRFEQAEGYRLEAEAKRILQGLGFGEKDWGRPIAEFSGGWQMRIALAKLLLQKPDLLLLDEPTNHLDLTTMEWLENYLREYPAAFMVVSHDRFFLNRIVRKIVAIEQRQVRIYPGDYAAYERERRRQIEQQWKAYSAQQEEIKRLQTFIDRFRYKATKAAQVQSRIKMLEKMERLTPPEETAEIHFRFPPAPKCGKLLLEAKNIEKRYNGKIVLQDLSFRLDRGERVAIIGANGSGKSTLCRILAGRDTDFHGELLRNERVKLGFFSQESAALLTGEHSVLEEARNHAPELPEQQLRSILGGFLFSGEDVEKPVNVLSGGEKSRLALACLLFQANNLLILDEPTNHLDQSSKDRLLQALKEFEGTLILVSHDRYFIDQLSERLLILEPGNARMFWGTYSDYLDTRQQEKREDSEDKPLKQKREKERRRQEAEERNRRYRMRRRYDQQIAEIETEITGLEQEKAKIEHQLTLPEVLQKGERVQELTVELHLIQRKLTEKYEHWTEIAEIIDRIENGQFTDSGEC